MPGEFLVARGHATALLEPTDTPLDHVPLPIGLRIQGAGVVRMVYEVVGALRDHPTDLVPPQPGPDAVVAVAAIPRQRLRPLPRAPEGPRDADRVEQARHPARLVGLPGADVEGERQPLAVGHQAVTSERASCHLPTSP